MTTTAKEPRLAGLSGFLQALQDEFDARYWPLAGQFLAAAELFGRRAEIRHAQRPQAADPGPVPRQPGPIAAGPAH